MEMRRVLGVGAAVLLLAAAVFYVFEAEKTPPPPKMDVSKEFSLSEGKAYFLDNRHLGKLYVIEADVTNNTPSIKCQITIKATLLDSNSSVVREVQQVAGTMASVSELRFLNKQELDQKLTPQGSDPCAATQLAPGGKAPVIAVFRDPPANATEYTLAVIDSKSVRQ